MLLFSNRFVGKTKRISGLEFWGGVKIEDSIETLGPRRKALAGVKNSTPSNQKGQ